MNNAYPAVVHKEKESCYGVSFPDFPGCVSAGPSLAIALTNAEDALALHMQGMTEDGEAIPEPSDLEAVAKTSDKHRAAVALVRASAPSRQVRINVSMDGALVDRIDAAARDFPGRRSGFLAAAAEEKLDTA